MSMLKFLLLAACGSLAVAQQYSITTVAGGAPPATPATAANVSIGQPMRVTTDSAGSVYFSSNHTVFKLSSGGTLTVVAGTSRAGFAGDGGPAVRAQLNTPQGMAVDSKGNVYIADSGNNRIRIVTPDGNIRTFAGNGTVSPGGPRSFGDGGLATDASLHFPMGVAVDKNGNVYIADSGDNCVRIVTTDGVINLVAGDSYPGYFGDTKAAVEAELHNPGDVAVDSSGNIYIADTANAYVRKIGTDGNINAIAGTGAAAYSGDDGPANKAGLSAPTALALDSSGNLYIVENGDSRVRKVDTSGNIVTVVGTDAIGFKSDTTSANHTPLNYPSGVAVDSSGNLYVADTQNYRVRKVSSGTISTVAGNGILSFSGDNGSATNAQMDSPQGVAADSSGNIYISDTNNNVVRRVTKSGSISTVAGNGTAGFGGDNGAATSAQLNAPRGLAVDSAGNLYIADSLNNRVRKVTAGGTISTVAGSGTAGFAGDGAAAASAQMYLPIAVAVDGGGNLYIADFNNSRIRKVTAGGTISTFAGNGATDYFGDGGQATAAAVNLPQGVAVDAGGVVYIADSANNVIRRVGTNGVITTWVGNGQAGYSGDGGPGTSAQIVSPTGIALDPAGNLYIAEGGLRVRKVFGSGLITTIAGVGTRGYAGDGGLAINAQLNGVSAVAADASGNVYLADTGNNAVRQLQFAVAGSSLTAVLNGASVASGSISPGEIIVLTGSGLGPTPGVSAQPVSGFFGTSLAGTSVYINGAQAPVTYASGNLVTAVVPYGITGSQAQVFVQFLTQTTTPITVAVAPVTPALFTADSSGKGQVVAVDQAGNLNSASNPADAGKTLVLYATGLGQTNPGGLDGAVANVPLPQTVAPVTVSIGGKTATTNFIGGVLGSVAGLTQIVTVVPSGLSAGSAAVTVTVSGVTSPAGTTIAVSGK